VKLLTVLLTIAGLSFGQTARKPTAAPIKPQTPARASYKAPVAKPTVQRPTAVPKANYRAQAPKATKVTATRYARTPVRRVYAPPVQQQPSQDRYREIQQALVEKGYLQGEATGQWDAGSVAALNRFKQDQNLKADGRLDSKALISLGLGPKKETYISTPGQVEAGTQEQ